MVAMWTGTVGTHSGGEAYGNHHRHLSRMAHSTDSRRANTFSLDQLCWSIAFRWRFSLEGHHRDALGQCKRRTVPTPADAQSDLNGRSLTCADRDVCASHSRRHPAAALDDRRAPRQQHPLQAPAYAQQRWPVVDQAARPGTACAQALQREQGSHQRS